MRLFVRCWSCGSEVNIYHIASMRNELPHEVRGKCVNPSCGYEAFYSKYEVQAAVSGDPLVGGAVVGGILGALVGGPIGLLVGGALGAGAGQTAQQQEIEKVRRFNES